jgi:hypothetical protein
MTNFPAGISTIFPSAEARAAGGGAVTAGAIPGEPGGTEESPQPGSPVKRLTATAAARQDTGRGM